MFNCPLCSKNFVTRTGLSSHTKSHTKEKPHKCPICSATFGHANSLKIHTRCVHNGQKIIKNRNSHCPLCSYKCYTKIMLEIHMRKHSDHFPLSCNVPSCSFKTKYEQCLKQHVRNVHNDARPYECPSDGCTYKSKTNGDLKKHLSLHSNEKPFACTVPGCNYTCKMKQYLSNHTSRAHSDEKPFKCSFCNFQAKLRPELIRHQHRHKKTKRFQCQAPDCCFTSYMKSDVELHFDRKHRKKDVLCTEPRCNFKCGSIALLNNHLKRHGSPLLKCPRASCSYRTTSKKSLVRHISRFHQDMGSRILDVETFGSAGATETLHCRFPDCCFQTKSHPLYDRHIVTHNKEEKRDQVCTFCFSRFRHLCQLRAHLQTHTGEKPYSCSYCDYTAASTEGLSAHGRAIHQIHVIPCGKENEIRKCRTCHKTFWSNSEFVLHSMSHLQPVVVLEPLKLHTL